MAGELAVLRGLVELQAEEVAVADKAVLGVLVELSSAACEEAQELRIQQERYSCGWGQQEVRTTLAGGAWALLEPQAVPKPREQLAALVQLGFVGSAVRLVGVAVSVPASVFVSRGYDGSLLSQVHTQGNAHPCTDGSGSTHT